MPLTAEQKPNTEWWWAWSQSILGRPVRASTHAETGATHLTERVALSGAGWYTEKLDAAPCSRAGQWAPQVTSTLSLQGRAQTPPPVPRVAPVLSALFFPAPILLHYLLMQAQPYSPPHCAWPPLLSGPLPAAEQISLPRTDLWGQGEQESRIS